LDALRQRGIPTVTMSVMTPSSIDHVDHVLDLAREYGTRAYFHLEHDKAMDVDQPLSPALTQARVAELALQLLDRKRRGLPVGNSEVALERQRDARYLITCDNCYAGSYYGYLFSDGTVSHCIFTQQQVERGNGRRQGYVNAFRALAPPTGPGCSCVPLHEVNRMLHLDVRVVYGALAVALKS
jgi:MoaA/NifB/PqqE/SkfB family radical SAM enzyme